MLISDSEDVVDARETTPTTVSTASTSAVRTASPALQCTGLRFFEHIVNRVGIYSWVCCGMSVEPLSVRRSNIKPLLMAVSDADIGPSNGNE